MFLMLYITLFTRFYLNPINLDSVANEDIINKVNNLADSSKKEELKGILSEVAVILDDTTAPGISGIDNGVVTALDVALTVDETNVTEKRPSF